MDDFKGESLLLKGFVLLLGLVPTDVGLEVHEELADLVVSQLLHLSQHSGTEEDLTNHKADSLPDDLHRFPVTFIFIR